MINILGREELGKLLGTYDISPLEINGATHTVRNKVNGLFSYKVKIHKNVDYFGGNSENEGQVPHFHEINDFSQKMKIIFFGSAM